MTEHVLATGIHNFRDMGGLKSADGRTVKKGLLFRSGHLANMTEADHELFKQLGIQLVFDYRDDIENDMLTTPALENIRVVREPAILKNSTVKVGDIHQYFADGALHRIFEDFHAFYGSLAFNNPSYKALLQEVVNMNVPLLHHCTAGKDRTGVGAALIYLLLGVDEAQITEEYLFTNKAINENRPDWALPIIARFGEDPRITALINVQRELIEALFEAILTRYNSYEAYFEGEYGITAKQIEQVRNYYLD